MSPQDRLRLIRAKASHTLTTAPQKAKGLYLATTPEAQPAHRIARGPDPQMPRRKWSGSVFGPDLYMSQTGQEWTKIPDPKPPITCEVLERHKPHYLDRIAEEIERTRKLPVLG